MRSKSLAKPLSFALAGFLTLLLAIWPPSTGEAGCNAVGADAPIRVSIPTDSGDNIYIAVDKSRSITAQFEKWNASTSSWDSYSMQSGDAISWEVSGSNLDIDGATDQVSVTIKSNANPSDSVGDKTLKVTFTPDGGSGCSTEGKVTIVAVHAPHGDPTDLSGASLECSDYSLPHQHKHCMAVWSSEGLKLDWLSAKPDLPFSWEISSYGSAPNTSVTWNPGGVNGVGMAPQLLVDYFDSGDFIDHFPPDNSWFGDHTITVSFASETFTRPVRVFFKQSANRLSLDSEKCVRTWFYYWGLGAVPQLQTYGFEYEPDLDDVARFTWTEADGPKFLVGPGGGAVSLMPVYSTSSGTYSEASYSGKMGEGVHSLAKSCEHEYWHWILGRETLASPYGYGYPDQDGDGLSDAREMALGTDPLDPDTCNMAGYEPGYAQYATYGDQELLCRVRDFSDRRCVEGLVEHWEK